MIRYPSSMMIFEIFVLAAITAALAFGREKRRSISDGIWIGAIGGLVGSSFIMFIASPALNLPWFALPRYVVVLLLKEFSIINRFQLPIIFFAIGIFAVLILGGVIGGCYAFVLRTVKSERVILSGFFYGLTVWALIHFFILPLDSLTALRNGFQSVWLAFSLAVYGLFIGTVFSYLPGWLLTTGKEKRVLRPKTRKAKKRKRTRRL